MLSSLSALSASIPSVLHLSSAPVFRTNSPFTHLLHCRYPSPVALANYSTNPNHVEVVHEAILPICDDIMAVDWVSTDTGSVESPAIPPGKAVKVTFLKLKEGLGEEEGKGMVLDAISGMKGKVNVGLEAVSFGSVAVFSGKEEMEATNKEEISGFGEGKGQGIVGVSYCG